MNGKPPPGNPAGVPASPWPAGGLYAAPVNDLAPFEGEPARPYIVAGSQRCGSTLLCDALGRTGLLGAPAEYMNFDVLGRQMLKRFGLRLGEKRNTLDEYLQRLYACRTSPNGVFGMKLQWHQYAPRSHLHALRVLLRRSRFVWIRRHDLVGQAISSAIANATGFWHDRGEGGAGRPALRYSRKLVDRSMQWILWENWGWARYFELNQVEPFEIYYEDLLADMDGVCGRVCEYLGLEAAPHFSLEQAPTRKLADTRSEEWRLAYSEIFREPSAPDPD